MEYNEKRNDHIELRSERVRKILGDIPKPLVVCGYIVLAVVTAGLVIMLCMLPEAAEQLTKLTKL